MENKKKILAFVLAVFLCFVNPAISLVNAQEITPDTTTQTTETVVEPSSSPESSPEATPTPAGDVLITNDAVVEDNIVTESTTGENVITSTATPSASPTTIPSPPAQTEESSFVEETSGPEESPSPESSPEATPATSSGEINTGDSVALSEVHNEVNSNIVDSVFVNHTLNIYLQEETQDLDLSSLSANAVKKVFEQDGVLEPEVSVSALSLNNFAYVENNVNTSSNTGDNSVEGGGQSSIQTGDSYAVVSILNNVNTNIVNSTFHIVTVNIFGAVNGDIILPVIQDDGCTDCSQDIDATNQAAVTNNVNTSANSGQNSIETGEGSDAEINTGQALSVVNVLNLVNTNLINTVFKKIYVNNLGNWLGQLLGWTNSGGQGGGNCESCFGTLSLQNNANVVNNVNTSSNTGGNSIQGGGEITTGNAYSSVSLVNFINTNIIGTTGFIGFINIFGTLTGDIGDEEALADPVEEPQVLQSQSQEQEDPGKEPGAELVLEANHNVGLYILPGDTITFTAKVSNPGVGKLYDTKVYIELLKDDTPLGGSYFNLGEIKPNSSKTLSTGIVISKKAPGGQYVARVSATGVAGPDIQLSDSTDLPFTIAGYTQAPEGFVAGAHAENNTPPFPPAVLGSTNKGLTDVEKRLITVFSVLLLVYLMGRGYQKREEYVFPVARKFGDYALRIGSLLGQL